MKVDSTIIHNQAMPGYLCSVLKYGNNQAFVIVCLLIDSDDVTHDLLTRLEEHGILAMICERISQAESAQALKYAARAIVRFARVKYYPVFGLVIGPFADEIRRAALDALPFLKALTVLSKCEQALTQIAGTRVDQALGPLVGIPQTAKWVRRLQNRIRAIAISDRRNLP
jgi:hypothetical protein